MNKQKIALLVLTALLLIASITSMPYNTQGHIGSSWHISDYTLVIEWVGDTGTVLCTGAQEAVLYVGKTGC